MNNGRWPDIDAKLKHLEMIQAVISRLAGNSFLIKAWSVTLIAALFALAAKDAAVGYIVVAYLPLCVFWGLDAYFLSLERRYRDLYNVARQKPTCDIDFDMTPPSTGAGASAWIRCVMSKTLIPFYLPLILLTGFVNLIAK